MLDNRGIEEIDMRIPLRQGKLAKTILELKGEPFFTHLHYWDTHTPYRTFLSGFNPIDIVLNMLRPLDRFKDIHCFERVLEAIWLFRVKRIRSLMQENAEKILPAVKKGYMDAVITADRFLGVVLKIIKAAGVADETLLVVTSDHGDSFNEHDEINRAQGKRYEHGQFLYDNIIKVPLIFFWPKRNFKRAPEAQVRQVDILPTILEALNVGHDVALDGKSLWHASIAEKVNLGNEFVFSEVVRESLDIKLKCVRSMSSKLICNCNTNEFELYDLRTDPDEKNNLWSREDCHEKEILMANLQALSSMGESERLIHSELEERQIQETLRNLGYID
jgi:arylsulfatase A-like enzyme